MQLAFAKKINEAAESTGEELIIREGYRGRNHVNAEAAVIGHEETILLAIFQVAFELGREDNQTAFEEFSEDIRSLHRDSMGKSDIIIY